MANNKQAKGLTILAKLRSQQGFTIAEQLISIIFIGLLCVVISAGIGSALAAHANISSRANAEQLLMRSIDEVNEQLTYSLSVQADRETFESPTTHTYVKLENGEQGIMLAGDVDSEGSTSVVFIPAAEGLVPVFGEVPKYNVSTNTWSYNIMVRKAGDELVSQAMSVARITPASS